MFKIESLIRKKAKIDCFVVELQFKVNSDYFIEKIEQGIHEENNLNYETNVEGKMTRWNYFVEDFELLLMLKTGLTHIEKDLPFFPKSKLWNAWGNRISLNDCVKPHNHSIATLSGVFYLNDSNQNLYFDEMDIVIKPKKGKLIFFSPILKHYTKISTSIEPRYSIAFNYQDLNKI